MKRLSVLAASLLMLICPCVLMHAQNQIEVASEIKGIDGLWNDYPLLMEKFGAELNNQRADYVFAIDVSGTMNQYKGVVVPALQEFFRSLQNGDYVSVIKFGEVATNEVGSSGVVDEQTVNNLVSYADDIYSKPATSVEKDMYFRYTNLDKMLDYVATDLKQLNRSTLKFVFIITDFVHDPRVKGTENWNNTLQRFKTEQSGNDVYVFALQLPGSGRDLETVRNVFPAEFQFNHVRIQSSSALSDWFSQRKNAIILDKFKAVIDRNISPAGLEIDPVLDIDGNLLLETSWDPCPVYDLIQVDSISLVHKDFRFRSSLPEKLTADGAIEAGKYIHKRAGLFSPKLVNLEDVIDVSASFPMPYNHELRKLGIEPPVINSSASVNRLVFCHPLPLWLCCVIIGLIILYIILVIRAASRNNSPYYQINGKFDVLCEGVSVDKRRPAKVRKSVDFGAGAEFYPVPGASWRAEIRVKTYNPFLLFFKSPTYQFILHKGTQFTLRGQKWGAHQKPLLGKGTPIVVGKEHTIRWIQ